MPANDVSLYSSAKVLFWLTVLGTYGFIEAILRLYRYIPRLYPWASWRWYNRTSDKEFYFRHREFSCRVYPGGQQYLVVREETVVARAKLSSVPISYQWTAQGPISERILPESLALVDAQRIKGQTSVRKRIQFKSELEKGQEQTYTFILRCCCTPNSPPPEPFLSSTSNHRVDRLILRVIFPVDEMPKRVFRVEQDRDGHELARCQIELTDYVNGEYRVEIRQPRAHTTYLLEWEK